MGGLTGGLRGGLEKLNSLITKYLAKNRGGLGKNNIIHVLQIICKHYLESLASAKFYVNVTNDVLITVS